MAEEFSAWNLWLHPRRYRDEQLSIQERFEEALGEIDDYQELLKSKEEENARLKTALSEKEKELTNALLSNLTLTSEKAALEVNLAKTEASLNELRNKFRETCQELNEYKSQEKEIEALAGDIENALKIKKDYERRIKDLQRRLREAKKALRMLSGDDLDNELSILDVKPAKIPQPPTDNEPKEVPPETDWLLELPESFL